jgi:hypothetical protein
LQDEAALTSAESNLVSAMAAYEKSQVEMDRATGLLLERAGIVMADAENGRVTHMPNVPYVVPRTDVQSVMPARSGLEAPAPPAQAPQPSPPLGF